MTTSTFSFISCAADLDAVPFIKGDADRMAANRNQLAYTLVQSALIHPDWTVDDAACYLVNDQGYDALDIVEVTVGSRLTLAEIWIWAKTQAVILFPAD